MAISEEFVKEGAKKMTDKDVEKVVNRSEKILEKFTPYGPLKRFIDDAKLLIALVKDYWRKSYRQTPFGVIGAIVFSLIYVFNPFDLVPDVLPILGQVDDASVIAACLMLIQRDLRKYEKWKKEQPLQLAE
ncbi:MAG TPA: YkvA family protein [Anaerolineales bacterium]|nr:YkvA family protein [Anaerolineales bacterium]